MAIFNSGNKINKWKHTGFSEPHRIRWRRPRKRDQFPASAISFNLRPDRAKGGRRGIQTGEGTERTGRGGGAGDLGILRSHRIVDHRRGKAYLYCDRLFHIRCDLPRTMWGVCMYCESQNIGNHYFLFAIKKILIYIRNDFVETYFWRLDSRVFSYSINESEMNESRNSCDAIFANIICENMSSFILMHNIDFILIQSIWKTIE